MRLEKLIRLCDKRRRVYEKILDEYSGKYSNQVAWERFTEYMVFYDEVVDYNNELAPAPALYDVYYAYDPATEEEAALCVDDVIQIAEENGAEIQIW